MRLADEGDKSVPFTAASVAGQNLGVLTHNGDIRWKANDSELRHSWKPEDAIAFMKPIVATAPIELIVVGDVKVDDVISSVAKTVGTLPKRSTAPEPKGLRNVAFPKATSTPVVLTHKGPATQGLVFVYWPTTDIYADPKAHRVRNVLASILRGRAFDKIRNSDGKSYSPQQTVLGERVLPGYGYMGLQVDAPPDAADGVFTSVDAIEKDLQTNPVGEDEFKRTVGPLIESARAQRQENGFWMSNLENAQTDPRVIAYQRTSIADYESITPADVMAAAQKWLKPDAAWRLKVVPEGK
jgi:zinc protease